MNCWLFPRVILEAIVHQRELLPAGNHREDPGVDSLSRRAWTSLSRRSVMYIVFLNNFIILSSFLHYTGRLIQSSCHLIRVQTLKTPFKKTLWRSQPAGTKEDPDWDQNSRIAVDAHWLKTGGRGANRVPWLPSSGLYYNNSVTCSRVCAKLFMYFSFWKWCFIAFKCFYYTGIWMRFSSFHLQKGILKHHTQFKTHEYISQH